MNSKTTATAAKEEAKPSLVPKRRFPEFRGMDGWKSTTLGEVTIKTDKRNKGGKSYPVYSISNKTGFTPQSEQFEGVDSEKRGYDIALYKLIESNTFAYNPARINVGSIGYSGDLNNVIISSLYVCFKAKPETADQFLQHFFGTSDFEKSVNNHVEGGIRSYLFYENFARIPIPLPSPSEQQKIAECLSSVDELMAAQARKVDALKIHKKGLMQQVFPREGETQPRLRFPEFQNAGEWEEATLSKFILSLDAGVSVNSGDRPASKTEFGVLKTSAVTNGIFECEENKVVLSVNEQSRLKEPVSGGTIIISRMNTPALVGANAYVESSHENLFLPDRLWAAKPRKGVSMRFLAFILGSDKGRVALSKLAKGSSGSMKNITKPEVLAFSVMAPSPAEQQRIAICLSSLDALITAETQKLEALKTHKKGLMQQLFPSPEAVEA